MSHHGRNQSPGTSSHLNQTRENRISIVIKLRQLHSLSGDTAKLVIRYITDSAKQTGKNVSIAIVDQGGHLLTFERMDDAYPGSVDAAIGKARSCAGFQTSTEQFSVMAEKESWIGGLPGVIPLGGAVPLRVRNEFVGAVSVSGDTESGEQELAEKGASYFNGLFHQNLPTDVRGIEHIGMTVPDVDLAEDFLAKVFGAVRLYSLVDDAGHAVEGKDVNSINGLDPKACINKLRMLRIANGANVELFEVSGNTGDGSKNIHERGIHHFSVYCDDLLPVTRRFADAGGELLEGPISLFGREEGAGNEIRFGRTPWGTLVEMIKFPSPLHYESKEPQMRWHP